MDKFINENFYSVCNKDVVEILDEVNEFIPRDFDIWKFDQSYFKDNNETIMIKPIYDDYGDKVGKGVDFILDNLSTSYRLEYKEEEDQISLEWEKQYYEDNNLVVKRSGVILENSAIIRSFYYEANDKQKYYDVGYDLAIAGEYQEYLNTLSLAETLESIKPSKTRKRN